ncbi:hypothetical protein Tco_1091657 [Tanacetum coccineum]|uniref:Uncharacterized protein n=1 Tax=Tanacetum coccineum TaxID=301880 RepID=A0ABQ5I8V3_9ASTR
METKDTLSSCLDFDEQEIQQLQKQAKILNKFNALKTTTQQKQLNNEILHEKDSKSVLSVIKVQFDKFIHSEMLKSSNYDSNAREARQTSKTTLKWKLNPSKMMKRLNERKLQIQECMVQKDKALNASSEEKVCSRIVSDKGNDQCLENQSNTSRDESMEKVNSNVIPDSPDMCDNEIQTAQNAVEYDDEHAALANLIANLKLDIDENKKI